MALNLTQPENQATTATAAAEACPVLVISLLLYYFRTLRLTLGSVGIKVNIIHIHLGSRPHPVPEVD